MTPLFLHLPQQEGWINLSLVRSFGLLKDASKQAGRSVRVVYSDGTRGIIECSDRAEAEALMQRMAATSPVPP